MNVYISYRVAIVVTMFGYGNGDYTQLVWTANRTEDYLAIYTVTGNFSHNGNIEHIFDTIINHNTYDRFLSTAYNAKYNRFLCFNDYNYFQIYEINRPGISYQSSFQGPSSCNISGIAFVHRHIYWIDLAHKLIGVTDYLRKMWTIIVNSALSMPHSIAVNDEKRYLFWSDIGSKAKIERSNLYGEERTLIIESSLNQPVNLLVDKYANRLFWMDEFLKSSDFNGNDIMSYNVPCGCTRITSFAIYKNFVYFGTKTGNISSYMFSQRDLIFVSNYHHKNSSIFSLNLISKENEKGSSNPCLSQIMKCEHICLPKDEINYVCRCDYGFSLNPDGITCRQSDIRKEQFLVYDSGRVYQVDPNSGKTQVVLKIGDNSRRFVYSYFSNGLIYYIRDRTIYFRNISDSEKEYNLFDSERNIMDIAEDQVTGNIYALCSQGLILRINSTHVQPIIDNPSFYIDQMYVHSAARRLFYTPCRVLVELNIDTDEEVNRISLDSCYFSMVFDFPAGYAYFSNKETIYQYDMTKRSVLGNSNSRFSLIYNGSQSVYNLCPTKTNLITDITLDDKYLYILENKKLISKINKISLKKSMLTPAIFQNGEKLIFVFNEPKRKIEASNERSDLSPIIGVSVAAGSVIVIAAAIAIGLVIQKRKRQNKLGKGKSSSNEIAIESSSSNINQSKDYENVNATMEHDYQSLQK